MAQSNEIRFQELYQKYETTFDKSLPKYHNYPKLENIRDGELVRVMAIKQTPRRVGHWQKRTKNNFIPNNEYVIDVKKSQYLILTEGQKIYLTDNILNEWI